MKHALILTVAVLITVVFVQAADAKPLTLDEVLFLKKARNTEARILQEVKKTGTVLKLTEGDKQRLRTAGFTEGFIAFLTGATGDRPVMGTAGDIISLRSIGRATDEEIKSYVTEKKMQFNLSATDELKLRQIGISDALIQWLRTPRPTAVTTPTTPPPTTTPPLIQPPPVVPPATQPPTTQPATVTAPPPTPTPTGGPTSTPAGDFGVTDKTAASLWFHDNVVGYHVLLPTNWTLKKEKLESGSLVQAYVSKGFTPGSVRVGVRIQCVGGGYQSDMLAQLAEFVRGSQIKAEITDAGAVATMGKLADGKLGGIAAQQFIFNEALKDGTKLVGMAVITIHKGHLVVLSVHRRATDTEGARAALLAAAGSFTFKQQ